MENSIKKWVQTGLEISLAQEPTGLRLTWVGKSTAREPRLFLVPILLEAFQSALAAALPLVLDFTALDYMNSATLTSVVKAFEESRRLSVPVVLEYSLSRRWQALSFEAFRTFETPDGRIKVTGK